MEESQPETAVETDHIQNASPQGAIFINLLLTDALLSGASDLSNAFELCCYAVRRLRGQPGPLILIYDFYYEIQVVNLVSCVAPKGWF